VEGAEIIARSVEGAAAVARGAAAGAGGRATSAGGSWGDATSAGDVALPSPEDPGSVMAGEEPGIAAVGAEAVAAEAVGAEVAAVLDGGDGGRAVTLVADAAGAEAGDSPALRSGGRAPRGAIGAGPEPPAGSPIAGGL
jgi:hypothetical protein